MKQTPSIQITLTPEQQTRVREASGRQIITFTLKTEALEPRVAPGVTMN